VEPPTPEKLYLLFFLRGWEGERRDREMEENREKTRRKIEK
jgi:hypothetical protein